MIEWEAKMESHHSGFDDPTIVAHAFSYGDGVWTDPRRRSAFALCGWADRSGAIVNDNTVLPVPRCAGCAAREEGA